MERMLNAELAQHAWIDGAWVRCRDCEDAFWGAFRDDAFLLVKITAHRSKAHGGAGRPQRRQAAVAAVGVLAVAQAHDVAQRLGRGIAREAFDLGPHLVIKQAHEGQEKHNLAEWHTYWAAPVELRKYLCPPVACDPQGRWLVVRRAKVGNLTHAQRDELDRAVGRYCGDLHDANVGTLDGQPVVIDYANGFKGETLDWGKPRW
jgi:hypothetical protein